MPATAAEAVNTDRSNAMRISNRYILKLGGLGITALTRQWMSTLRYHAAFYDAAVDPAHPHFQGPAIFLLWHEYIPFLFYLRGHCHVAMLLSQHQDAEWLSQAAGHMGFDTIRGSTNRGGLSALRELIRTGETMNLAITPDGPRGPASDLGRRLHLRFVPPGHPARADRTGVRLPLADSQCVGPVCGAPPVFASVCGGRSPGADPGGHQPSRGGALSAARRTHAQYVHAAGRTVGRIGRRDGRAAAGLAAERRPPRRGRPAVASLLHTARGDAVLSTAPRGATVNSPGRHRRARATPSALGVERPMCVSVESSARQAHRAPAETERTRGRLVCGI